MLYSKAILMLEVTDYYYYLYSDVTKGYLESQVCARKGNQASGETCEICTCMFGPTCVLPTCVSI